MEKFVESKKGYILDNSEDIFTKSKFKCQNGHIFELYNNDIILNKKWCEKCQNENFGDKILKELDLAEYFITSKASLFKNEEKNKETLIKVKKSAGEKCPRCWKILEQKCSRCAELI